MSEMSDVAWSWRSALPPVLCVVEVDLRVITDAIVHQHRIRHGADLLQHCATGPLYPFTVVSRHDLAFGKLFVCPSFVL